MIINSAPQNEAVLSNVGEIGEFRIRNSAKAFSILSSGLYANKIKAIVRELSCNAVDSHTAAGKQDTPFDVHLPNELEPHFSIRDYGTGLTHEQVTQIYTTYFESTKTNSNEFIGALGLGSKSPFSYTDNFTVTAIKDGRKGIYSAFINGQGVPSIALMMSEDSDEPAGVEVKFSVNDRYDYSKFRDECRSVYTYFKLRPVISGADFKFTNVTYETENIIPGVHSMQGGSYRSVAVMGNIAYPIDIPNTDTTLGNLKHLLTCGLEMHFAIGELDMQASREGLSYIPSTVESIKRKLEEVNAALTEVLKTEADAFTNMWERAQFLSKKKDVKLWHAAVDKYATDTKISTFKEDKYGSWRLAQFTLGIEDLASRYNIQLRAFSRRNGVKAITNRKPEIEYGAQRADGHYDKRSVWHIGVNPESHFIVNDLKTGAGERAKYHYRETPCKVDSYQHFIYVLDPVDRTKSMNTRAFFKLIKSPPKANIINASTLMVKERTGGMARDVTIMRLEERGSGGYYRSKEMVWRDAGQTSTLPAVDAITGKAKTYYYVPLSGFTMQSAKGYTSGKELYDDVTALPKLFDNRHIYGVRKSDLEEIKTRKNWVNLEDHIATLLNGKDVSKLLMSLVLSKVDGAGILQYTIDVDALVPPTSPYIKFINAFKGVEKFKGNTYNIERLFRRFAPNTNISPDALTSKYQQELNTVNDRYPLLTQLNTYRVDAKHIAEYVNLIDEKKGV